MSVYSTAVSNNYYYASSGRSGTPMSVYAMAGNHLHHHSPPIPVYSTLPQTTTTAAAGSQRRTMVHALDESLDKATEGPASERAFLLTSVLTLFYTHLRN
jgi:hypothetical protein